MIFWIFIVFFVAVVTMVVLWAVAHSVKEGQRGAVVDSVSSNIKIYKIQLAEIEADLKRGLIDNENAEEARLELSRNILASEKQKADSKFLLRRDKALKIIIIIAVLCVPVVTLGVYSLIGQPDLKSHSFNELMTKDREKLSAEEKLVRTEALFARNPEDGKLADELATAYLIQGRFQDAVNTYVSALRLNGETAPRLVGYGMALIGYNDGTINDDAQKSFEKAAKLAPGDFYPRLFIAQSLHQSGKTAEAIKSLTDFLARVPKDNAGRQRVEAMIKDLQNMETESQLSQKGGLNEEKAATKSEQNEKRDEIIAMIDRLAARLQQNPDDLDGWKQLIHSWLVLKETNKALLALKEGQLKLSRDKASELISYAKVQGLVLKQSSGETDNE